MSEAGDMPTCLNCGARLAGQYCGQCGQRATSRFISIWELTRDAFGDMFELDSRLWRTLLPLLLKPGLLTRDYLEGRRARYMPPFRMYLVLSLIFFAVAFFDPKSDLAILFEPQPETETVGMTGMTQEEIDERVAAARLEGQRAIEELIADGVLQPDDVPEALRDELAAPPQDTADADADAAPDGPGDATADATADGPKIHVNGGTQDDSGGFNITLDEDGNAGGICEEGSFDASDMPAWFQKRFTPERLETVCERIENAGLRGLGKAILEKIPAGLIILLPFLALVLKMLYPLSRRYYVEHLLFFVHYHAFFFLILTLQVLLARLGSWIGVAEGLFTVIIIAASFYIPAYLFVAMRRVYGQGRFVTFLKFIWLTFWYLVGFTIVMTGAVLIAAFSI